MSRLRRLAFGYGIGGVAVIVALASMDVDWSEALAGLGTLDPTAAGLAFAAFLCHGALNACAFGALLQGFSGEARVGDGAAAWAASVLTKYVPGSVWHIVARGALLSRLGVRPAAVLATGVIEQTASLGSASMIALALLAPGAGGVLGGVAVAGVVAGIAVVAAWLVPAPPRARRARSIAAAIFLYALAMLPFAAGYLMLTSPPDVRTFLGWLFAGTASGVAVFVTPGGVGVRESVLAAALQDLPGLLAIALVARLLIVASEVVLTGVGAWRAGGARARFAGWREEAHETSNAVEVVALGVGLRGDGYPNAEGVLRSLRSIDGVAVSDRVRWLPVDIHLWRVFRGPLRERLGLAWILGSGSLRAAIEGLGAGGHVCYVPYPAVFALWWLSWVPRRFRPTVIADAYISVWDSAFRDRRRGGKEGWLARVVRRSEGRALRTATRVIVDTRANRDWMIALFSLDPERVMAWPLAIDARRLLALVRPHRARAPLRVLFVGTLVPLHGIDVVAGAIERLASNPAVEWTIVGTGQDAHLLAPVLARLPDGRVRWIRDWQDGEAVARHFRQADVALGVFGGPGKASRVLPFKVYMALAAGLPVVTQRELSLPEGVPEPPLVAVDPTPAALAQSLEELAADQEAVRRLGEAGRRFFERHLGDERRRLLWSGLVDSCVGDSGLL
ncbi:glycosyltransferase [Coralloluteibacterium stylophorae]|uniref:Glycosyltransferase n=1 Tax=Coralloluteibacterium stylophorae TaxID=1776034 RepID=A0A8J7VWY5_9GAMM|nr:glycosyltransferase [Coralloluteibacterium stylophorae]MBS7457724.1 glycosyltransferase [Coralloluteibacterium stylophorae]